MVSAVIMDAGTFSPRKLAVPMSLLVVLMAPAAVTDRPVLRPSPTDPNLTSGLPASCCVSAADRVDGIRVHAAPLGSIERVARLLTRLPTCTTMGMAHPVTPSGR